MHFLFFFKFYVLFFLKVFSIVISQLPKIFIASEKDTHTQKTLFEARPHNNARVVSINNKIKKKTNFSRLAIIRADDAKAFKTRNHYV